MSDQQEYISGVSVWDVTERKTVEDLVDYINEQYRKMAEYLAEDLRYMMELCDFKNYIDEINGGWFV